MPILVLKYRVTNEKVIFVSSVKVPYPIEFLLQIRLMYVEKFAFALTRMLVMQQRL